MDEMLSDVLMGVPESTVNLTLPDPVLRNYYRDEQDRIYWMDGVIADSSLDLIRMIMECNKADKGKSAEERKPITVMIDSVGGSVEVLWSIVKAIEISKTPVRTVCYCSAMSAAADLLASGTPGMRYCMPGTSVMMHAGSCSYSGSQQEVEAAKKFYDAMGKKLTDYVIVHTNIDTKTAKKMKNDYYMSEVEALELGIIDHIITDMDELF